MQIIFFRRVIMTLSEKAKYLSGLMDGLGVDDSTPTGKILLAIGDLLDEIASSVDTIDSDVDDIVEFCNNIDEDLSDVEQIVYGDDDDEDDECCDDDDECCCDDHCDCHDDEDDTYEVVCPTCGDTIELTYEMVQEGSIKCPNCGELLEFDLGSEEPSCEKDENK